MRYTDGFTGKAILALKEAICAAEELGHTYIGSEHLRSEERRVGKECRL